MKINKMFAISLFMINSVAVLAGCGEPQYDTYCQFTITSIMDEPVNNAYVKLFNSKNKKYHSYGVTNKDGKCNVPYAKSGDYYVTIENGPKGSYLKDEVLVSGEIPTLSIKLCSQIIEEPIPDKTAFKLNNVIYDYKFVDTNYEDHYLSQILKEKEFVLLNFWETYCDPCKMEFPYMNMAYNDYKDRIEILAIAANGPMDTLKDYKEEMGLDFPVCLDKKYCNYFGLRYVPTTIIINKYGIYVYKDDSGVSPSVNKKTFTDLFDEFLSIDYMG